MPLDLKKLLIARFLFTFAVQMQAVILGWRIYELLKNPLYLGLIGLSEAVPAIGLAIFAGYIVDKSRPLLVYRRVMYVSFISGSLVLAEHLFVHSFSLPIQVGLLYFAAFLTGFARSFSQPSIYSSLPRLVERADLLKATATMSSAMQTARIAGPAFGGLAYGFLGATASSSIVCVSLLGAISMMLLIKKVIPPSITSPTHKSSLNEELFSGIKFVLNHPILFPALTLDMISVLFGGVTALLPIFASEILMVGSQGLGFLRAAPAIGATIMNIYLAKSNIKNRAGFWLFVGVTGFGCSILVFGFSKSFMLSLIALIFSGLFDSISMVIRSMAVQLSSPDHMRGKISAVNSIFIGSSNEIGEVESGLAAKFLGTVPAVYFGGIVCLLTVMVVAVLSPTLRKLDLEKLDNK